MSEPLLPCVELGPKQGARASVVWLHGLGADGHDFEPIVPELGLAPGRRVRFVFPTAPAIPVTINAGFVMPAWYDIRSGDLRQRNDVEGLLRSAARVAALLDRELARGVPAEAIVLAGFSQGGAVALYLALHDSRPLAGVIALSTYLVEGLPPEPADVPRRTVFAGHGVLDEIVPLARGEAAAAALTSRGHDVRWASYRMGHEVCRAEIADLAAWLDGRLPG